VCPHDPQLSESPFVSVQNPAQFVAPVGQVHAPAVHVALPPHALLHEPQCAGSREVSVHVPKQSVSPVGQPHAPATHDFPDGHELVHEPQWVASFCTSMHVPGEPQSIQPMGHPVSGEISRPRESVVCAESSLASIDASTPPSSFVPSAPSSNAKSG